MISFRDRSARGRGQFGWLDSRHTFSFGEYHDPEHMSFRSLRVINEDRVVPGAGFPTHSHRDMEILSYVLDGALAHQDNLGNGSVIRPGDVQRMSAGRGIAHSEFNANNDAPVHFLQIWIIPAERGIDASYEQRNFPLDQRRNELILVADRNGTDGAVTVHQDARLFLARLDEGHSVKHKIAAGRGAWVQVARGVVAVNGTEMREGDGAAIENESEITIQADTAAEALLFDLA